MPLDVPSPAQNQTLLGQEAAEAALLGAYKSGRLPHAWLFTGRFGVGKATLAFRFARFLLAGGGDTFTLPGDHPVAGPIAAGAHQDLIHVAPKAAGRGSRAIIEVDVIRDALERIKRTSIGAHRVMIIEEAHALNLNSANALLKTLEEPGEGVVIILTADSDARFPGTIRSRVARLRLQPLPDAPVVDWLGRYGVGGDAARVLATLAAGSPGLAVWLHNAEAVAHYQRLCEALRDARGEGGVGRVLAALESMLAAADAALVRELVGQLLRRAVAHHLGAPAEALTETEPAVLERLGHRLDRLWQVWDKLAVFEVVAERLSLDRPSLLVDIAGVLATADQQASA